MASLDLIGIGALNIDRLYRVRRILEDGEEMVEAWAVEPGGSAANTVYALARWGLRCGFIGMVGADAEGQQLLASFAEAGVDTTGVVRKVGAPTGQALCLVAGSSLHSPPTRASGPFVPTHPTWASGPSRSIYLLPGANGLLTPQEIEQGYIARARWLHLSSFAAEGPRRAQEAAVAALSPEAGVSLSLGALYAHLGLTTLAPILERTTILFANASELRELTGQDLVGGAEACLRAGCRTVVVTLGEGLSEPSLPAPEAGAHLDAPLRAPLACYIASQEGHQTVAALAIHEGPAVDTTGAGDAFAAGFLLGHFLGWPPPRCGSLGHVAAGFCLQALGARAGLPSRQALLERHSQLYP